MCCLILRCIDIVSWFVAELVSQQLQKHMQELDTRLDAKYGLAHAYVIWCNVIGFVCSILRIGYRMYGMCSTGSLFRYLKDNRNISAHPEYRYIPYKSSVLAIDWDIAVETQCEISQ